MDAISQLGNLADHLGQSGTYLDRELVDTLGQLRGAVSQLVDAVVDAHAGVGVLDGHRLDGHRRSSPHPESVPVGHGVADEGPQILAILCGVPLGAACHEIRLTLGQGLLLEFGGLLPGGVLTNLGAISDQAIGELVDAVR